MEEQEELVLIQMTSIEEIEAAAYGEGYEYTPCLEAHTETYWHYRAHYSSGDLLLTEIFSPTRLEGLTPINPSKPMFPKKA